jgi:hypothetical protein
MDDSASPVSATVPQSEAKKVKSCRERKEEEVRKKKKTR